MATPLTKLYPDALPEAAQPLFINRDLSLIEFYRRVLGEALNAELPLLERVKFISIFSSLVDEFYMIRIGTLREKADGNNAISADGLTPSQQLDQIRENLHQMVAEQTRCFRDQLLPELRKNGIVLLPYSSLSSIEQQHFAEYFKEQIFPVLTPQAVDPSHPFPYISGGTLNLGLYIRPELDKRVRNALQLRAEEIFVRLKIPAFLPRLLPVPGRNETFVLIEELVKNQIALLIPGAAAEDCHEFRITRDADIELRESEAADLLEMMEQNLRQRRFGDVTRLEVSRSMPEKMCDYLSESMEIEADEVYRIDGLMKLSDIGTLTKLARPELKDRPLKVSRPGLLTDDVSMFEQIRSGDILLHHPYMPYSIVTDFIAEAADDPDVLAIKICLYRLGADSPIPPLLIRASESGKQVTALIELKARFDEGNNIEWARKLEEAGVHVIYGLLGLKTHAKTTLIVRREGDGLRRYAHIATGNYNPETSAAYTDLGLLTSNPDICADASELFNFLTAYTRPDEFRRLLVAPINLRTRMLELIEREAEHARNGRPARIVAKLNRLADHEIVNALYDASQAGVSIDLIIRGICTLRPGIPGVSDNIRVRSVVGRLLEHSRVYYFSNGGREEVYIGSSDWMPRNLDRRVEVLVPILSKELREYLRSSYLETYLGDNVNAHELSTSGNYLKVTGDDAVEQQLAQEHFENDERLEAALLASRSKLSNVANI
ncbi:MAG: polyphosphate kinase 1 [Pyrinomonadaceae bacterium]|nr:polyphosphate kinase 1 [Pyrinomonadaceae bacterium]